MDTPAVGGGAVAHAALLLLARSARTTSTDCFACVPVGTCSRSWEVAHYAGSNYCCLMCIGLTPIALSCVPNF
jgi:hypothetical protein